MNTKDRHSERRNRAAAGQGPYASAYHAPVLAREVVEHLITDSAGLYVDATLGGGGHAAALLDALEPGGQVIGIDRDAEALAEARERLAEEEAAGRFRALRGNFADLETLLADAGPVNGLLLDLGVSSHQIDAPERGFSFQAEGPLDMRMDERQALTAEEIVNRWDEAQIKQLLYDYGEERRAPRIARKIVEARPLQTTGDLAVAVRSVVPDREEVKTLARVFQALRIAVNRELEALEQALEAGRDVLPIGGRMAVISYHSLEDRRVKRFFRYGNFQNKPVRDFYGNLITPWRRVVKGPIQAEEEEVAANPRARSARLRIAERHPTSDDDKNEKGTES